MIFWIKNIKSVKAFKILNTGIYCKFKRDYHYKKIYFNILNALILGLQIKLKLKIFLTLLIVLMNNKEKLYFVNLKF